MDLARARDGEYVVAGAVGYVIAAVPRAFSLVIPSHVGWEMSQPGRFLEMALELGGFEGGEGVP